MDAAEQKYEQLVLSHLGVIRERCWYYSGADRRVFEELLNEVLADLWEAVDRYDPAFAPRQQRKWVRERCRGVYKRHRRLFGTSLLPVDFDPAADLEPALLRETVDDLAAGLDDDERRLLDLLLQGYSHGECAQRMGMSQATLSRRYHRMIEKMKQQYLKTLQR